MRWAAGILLVCAALLKAAEFAAKPALAMLSPLGRYALPAEIAVEFGVGLLLLSGIYWRRVRWLAIVFFAGFAGYSLNMAIRGAASCDCFGPLHIHPWYTFFIDLIVASSLLLSALRARRQRRIQPDSNGAQPMLVHQRSRFAITAIMAITVAGTALLIRYVDRRTAVAEGPPTTGGSIILEPRKWIGQRLPISASIDIDLSKGNWLVLLHRHDCPDCQRVVHRYEQLAKAIVGKQIALVEVPPYGVSARRDSACRHGRLNDDREWFLQTPVEIELQDGIVTSVNGHGD